MQGTVVKLSFRRFDGDREASYDVRLVRGTAEYFAAAAAANRHNQNHSQPTPPNHQPAPVVPQLPLSSISSHHAEDDTDPSRQKLRQSLSQVMGACEVFLTNQNAADRDEIERLKRQLQAARESSARREREFEAGHAQQLEELNRMQEALRRAEAARKDAEARVAPLQHREQELLEELNRQREKERLRKEYIEELKKRQDEEKARLESMLERERAGRREEQFQRSTAEAALQKLQVHF